MQEKANKSAAVSDSDGQKPSYDDACVRGAFDKRPSLFVRAGRGSQKRKAFFGPHCRTLRPPLLCIPGRRKASPFEVLGRGFEPSWAGLAPPSAAWFFEAGTRKSDLLHTVAVSARRIASRDKSSTSVPWPKPNAARPGSTTSAAGLRQT